ncbi:B3 domain-containing protein REM20-like [Primulina huaijiensis]|uniref:B3 domain-containing protein REM20-like n=1 Tax=Primulina huaijiensis TaxID=1492673 RepID=UPI003CC7712D
MGREQRSKPSFFKVLSNEGFTRQLRLPIVFVQKYDEILAENTILRASSGESWAVKLEHVEDHRYFTRGWSKFAEDLGLRMGEFLVFWSAAKSTFDVSVYGIRGCARVISNCKSEFGSSYSDKEVETLSIFTKHSLSEVETLSIFTKHSHRDVSNKRVKTSSLEKDEGRNPLNVDRSSPLYIEIVLKHHHVSRAPL